MSILNEMIAGLLFILNNLILVYMWIIIIAALLTWVRPDPFNPIVQLLYRLTNPAYALVRRYMPTMFNGIDLAPLIIIVILQVAQVLIAAVVRAL
jgi:YggT family protein